MRVKGTSRVSVFGLRIMRRRSRQLRMELSPYRLWDGNVSLSRNDKLAGPYLILARTAAEERAQFMPLLDEEPTDWRTAWQSPEKLQVRTAARMSRCSLLKSEAQTICNRKGAKRRSTTYSYAAYFSHLNSHGSRQFNVLEVSPFLVSLSRMRGLLQG
jgi:hypothetical protein